MIVVKIMIKIKTVPKVMLASLIYNLTTQNIIETEPLIKSRIRTVLTTNNKVKC